MLEELERNPAFAERLASKLDGALTLAVVGRRRGPVAPPPALMAMDLKAALAEHGQIALRERVSGFGNAELAAFVRARGLVVAGAGRMNKTALVNAILRSAR